MLNPIRMLTTPEYLFHPRQAWRRLRRLGRKPQLQEFVRLPWGAMLRVHTRENIGNALYYYGIFDRVVPEAIARLLDTGEFAVEAGANIGQNCSCMAHQVGPGGQVLAFEPHPEIVAELRQNASLWDRRRFAAVQIEQVALGSSEGEALLDFGTEFQTNRGSAAIRSMAQPGCETAKVKMARLDNYVSIGKSVAVCKIDVEGHELEVLRGAQNLLKRCGIRDIIFEDFQSQPSPVTAYLRDHGYEVFYLGEGWLRPLLLPPGARPPPGTRDTHNYLATSDSARVRARYRPAGWRCLMYL